MSISRTGIKELTARYRDILRKCAYLNAIILMSALAAPAMAEMEPPVTDKVTSLFGDITIADQATIDNTAFGGRRTEWDGGKYNNKFPQYQMAGRSFELKNSVAYVGPVELTLRELTNEDKLIYNYQLDNQDVDLAALAGVDFGSSQSDIFTGVAGVIGEGNAAYTAPGVIAFANRDAEKAAGSMNFDNVNAVIDGATVNANTINVQNGSTLTFVKQDPSSLEGAERFFTNAEDIDSTGKSNLNANTITVDGSRMIVNSGAELTINPTTSATFTNNTTDEKGGAIYNEGVLDVASGSFSNNATTAQGGAIFNYGTTTIDGATFTGNKTTSTVWPSQGGAIFNSGDDDYLDVPSISMTISNSTFGDENDASKGNQSLQGGAIANESSLIDGEVTLNNVKFYNNKAFADTDGSDGYNSTLGGAIWNQGVMTANGDTIFKGNTAEGYNVEGGAIYNSGSLTFNDSVTFDSNTATDINSGNGAFGGALSNSYVAETTFKDFATFTNNKALTTADEGTQGGAIYNANEVNIEKGALFSGNEATYGGAIFNDDGAITITDGSFKDNTAGDEGGAIFNYGGTVNINAVHNDVVFSGNTANGQVNDISNYFGTINFDAADGRNITLAGIMGPSGTINKKGDGTLNVSEYIAKQTINLDEGELHLTTGENNLYQSTINVAGGATINTIDDVINDYMTDSKITLANGAIVKGDIDFFGTDNEGAADTYAATDGATIKYALGNLIGSVGKGTRTIQVTSDGVTVNASEAKFTSDNGASITSTENADGKIIVKGFSGGLEEAVDESGNVARVSYQLTEDESVNSDKEVLNNVIIEGDGITEGAKGVDLNAELSVGEGSDLSLDNLKVTGTGKFNNKAGATMRITNSRIGVDIDTAGIFYSDPTYYDAKVVNTGTATFDNDIFESGSSLTNSATVDLKNGVEFKEGSTLTGQTGNILNLLNGTTIFNGTSSGNNVVVANGAKFKGNLTGGSVDLRNGVIDAITEGTTTGSTLYLDANMTGAGTIDTLGTGSTGVIKAINLTASEYGDADSISLAVGNATLADDVAITGAMNYYTKVEKDGTNVVFSDKLVNTSTIRGTGTEDAPAGDVVLGDKAATTTVGTERGFLETNDTFEFTRMISEDDDDNTRLAKVTVTGDDYLTDKTAVTLYAQDTAAKQAQVEVDATNQKVAVTAANGLDVTSGSSTTTLTAKSTGLDISNGLTVAGTSYGINSTGAASVKSLTLDGTAVTSTAAELNELHGSGVKTADLTKLHNVTASADELNLLTGMTAVQTTKITGTGSTTALATTASVAATTGKIDSLITTDGSTNTYNGSATSTNIVAGDYKGNLTIGAATVEDHLVSLDNAVGIRDYTTGTGYYLHDGESIATSLEALNLGLKAEADLVGTKTTAWADNGSALANKTIGAGAGSDITIVGALDLLNTGLKDAQDEIDAAETALGVLKADGTYDKTALSSGLFKNTDGTAAETLAGSLNNMASNIGTKTTAWADDGSALANKTIGAGATSDITVVGALDALNTAVATSTKIIGAPGSFAAGTVLGGSTGSSLGDGTGTTQTIATALNTLNESFTNGKVETTFKSLTVTNVETPNADQFVANTDGSIHIQKYNTETSAYEDTFNVAANGNMTTTGTVKINGTTLTGKDTSLEIDKQLVDAAGFKVDANTSLTSNNLTVGDGSHGSSLTGTSLTIDGGSELTKTALTTTTVNATTVNVGGATGIALTKVTDSDADYLNVAAGLKVGTSNQFQVDPNGDMTVRGQSYLDGGAEITGTTTLVNSSDDTKKVSLSANTNGDLVVDNGINVAGGNFTVDTTGNTDVAGGLMVGTDNAFQVANTGAVTTAGSITTASTLTADDQSKFAKDDSDVYSLDVTKTAVTANKVVAAKAGITFGPLDTTAMTSADHGSEVSAGATGQGAVLASVQTIAATRSAINDEVNGVLGGIYKIEDDGSVDYNNAVLAGNGFKKGTGANLSAQLNDYAADIATATGLTFNETTGANTTTYAEKTDADTGSYGNIAASTSLRAAVEKVDKNIGLAMAATGSERATEAFRTNATQTVNQNLSALDATIGTDVTEEYNGVVATNSVNANIDAINQTIGDIDTLEAGTGSTGDAITKGTGEAATTVVEAINNIDATLGQIHALKDDHSTLGDNSNLAEVGTVENHFIALDNAIGDRTQLANSKYMKSATSVSDALMSLDQNLADTEHRVHTMEKEMKGGFASVAALSALAPNARATGNTQIALGTAVYRDHQGMAIGAYHYFNDNILANIGASYGGDKSAMLRAGVTFGW